MLTFPAYAVPPITLEGSGKAGNNVALAPSVSYCIIISSVFHPDVASSVAAARRDTALRDAATRDPGR